MLYYKGICLSFQVPMPGKLVPVCCAQSHSLWYTAVAAVFSTFPQIVITMAPCIVYPDLQLWPTTGIVK